MNTVDAFFQMLNKKVIIAKEETRIKQQAQEVQF